MPKIAIKKVTTNKDIQRQGKKEKDVYNVPNLKIATAIDNLVFKRQMIEELEAETALLEHKIKDYARRIYANKASTTGQQPDSFTLQGLSRAVMFIVQDTYGIQLTPEMIRTIKEIYGKDIVTVENKYSISGAFMKKYGKEIDNLIQKSKVIKAEDKPVIVKVTKHTEITKGTLADLPKLSKKSKRSVSEIYTLLEPKEQFKTVDYKEPKA